MRGEIVGVAGDVITLVFDIGGEILVDKRELRSMDADVYFILVDAISANRPLPATPHQEMEQFAFTIVPPSGEYSVINRAAQ